MPVLEMVSVRKTYGRRTALDGLDLECAAGEVLGLLGPNGAGKTTTLKIVAGLVRPDSGEVRVGGVDALSRTGRARSMVAFVPDQPMIYPRLTGREFLRFIAAARDLGRDLADERIGFCERLFDMSGWLDSRAESYSHGMTQRVALSSAFLARPLLYAIDEPLVGLDPASASSFHSMCRAAASSGAAVVLSTHTLPTALRMCDRLCIMAEGRIVMQTPAAGLDAGSLEEAFFGLTGSRPADAGGYFT
jgi:ABC-2 type transport system ATP-binding protein